MFLLFLSVISHGGIETIKKSTRGTDTMVRPSCSSLKIFKKVEMLESTSFQSRGLIHHIIDILMHHLVSMVNLYCYCGYIPLLKPGRQSVTRCLQDSLSLFLIENSRIGTVVCMIEDRFSWGKYWV